jgi:glycosyltransferase involved in cell wall biosynthesis
LHVLTRFEAGAGGNTLLSAVGMDPARYEIWIAGAPGGPLWERAERAGVRTVLLHGLKREVSPLADLAVLRRLVHLIRRERFTIVHLHNAKGGFLGRLAALLCRTPLVIYTLHGRDPWWPVDEATPDVLATQLMSAGERRAFLFLERALRRATHAFVAVAPKVAEQAVRARIATPGRIRVIPSAVEIDDIPDAPDRALRAELGVAEGGPLIGTVGRIDEQKAPLDFVRMAAEVAARRPDAHFVMVGSGELEPAVRREAVRLGVELLITGFRPDAARIAASMDVFVISSLYEGLGRALTEALAAARPVVATAVDGVPDLVRSGSTGLLAAPGDWRALAGCVLWMLDHPDEARAMGEAGRAVVRSTFGPATMCALLDEMYSELLGLPGGTAGPLQEVVEIGGPGARRSRLVRMETLKPVTAATPLTEATEAPQPMTSRQRHGT